MSFDPSPTVPARNPKGSFQDMILALHAYWSAQGCVILQPLDMRVGAGTFHPATTLRSLGPEPWNAAYVQPSRRPTDGRYGENPNRLQHYYQYQVIMKPSPPDLQELYLKSLEVIGIDPLKHDVRFVEDDWESPTLGAWGLGWEVWCDGMEVTQFTYFQQMGGFDCKPVAGELTYGLERLAMYIQGVDNVYDLAFNDQGVSYGEVFLENEKQMSKWNFEVAETDALFDLFSKAEAECRNAIDADVPIAAYEQAIEASHIFNLLQARGVISVQERASYMARVRDLARGSCEAFMAKESDRWAKEFPGVVGMSDFLLELRSEEIPARMQAGARAELKKLFQREMDAAGVAVGDITVWSTPRRLALIARDLPEATEAISEEAKGPPEGAPDQAIDGFCRKKWRDA